MFKKLTLLAMAIGALVAFAVPAAASAEALLTEEGEKAAESVTATSDSLNPISISTGLGTIQCTSTMWNIALTENTTTTAAGLGNGTAVCNISGFAVNVTNITLSAFDLDAQTDGIVSLSYTFDIPAIGAKDCTVFGTVGLDYAHNTNTVQIGSPNKLSAVGQAPCPSAATISGALILEETGGGNPVIIM